jgi:hypothetical protein
MTMSVLVKDRHVNSANKTGPAFPEDRNILEGAGRVLRGNDVASGFINPIVGSDVAMLIFDDGARWDYGVELYRCVLVFMEAALEILLDGELGICGAHDNVGFIIASC